MLIPNQIKVDQKENLGTDPSLKPKLSGSKTLDMIRVYDLLTLILNLSLLLSLVLDGNGEIQFIFKSRVELDQLMSTYQLVTDRTMEVEVLKAELTTCFGLDQKIFFMFTACSIQPSPGGQIVLKVQPREMYTALTNKELIEANYSTKDWI